MEDNEMNPTELAHAFVDRINAHDVNGLYALMTEDHSFVDGGGDKYSGRETMRKGWQDYFAMVPDFWIKLETIIQKGNLVALFGKSGGTYAPNRQLDPQNKWEVPAAWRVIVQENKILTWQVYVDSEQLRQIIVRIEEEERS